MERFTHSLKVLWRSERLLKENDLRLATQKIQFNALAGLVALFGLVMLTLAAFFALAPHWGQSLAALAVAGADLSLAVVLVAYARAIKPAAEVEMIKEVRNLALTDIQHQVALAEAEIVALKNHVEGFIRNPVDTLFPGIVGALFRGATEGLLTKQKDPS